MGEEGRESSSDAAFGRLRTELYRMEEESGGPYAGLLQFTIFSVFLIVQRTIELVQDAVGPRLATASWKQVGGAGGGLFVLGSAVMGGSLAGTLLWPVDVLLLQTRWWVVVVSCGSAWFSASKYTTHVPPLLVMALWASQSPGQDDEYNEYMDDYGNWTLWDVLGTLARVGAVVGIHQYYCKTAGDEAWLVFISFMWYLWRWFASWGYIGSVIGLIVAGVLGQLIPAIISQAVLRTTVERDLHTNVEAGAFGPLDAVEGASPEVAKVLAAENLFAVMGFTALTGELVPEEDKKYVDLVRKAFKRLALRCHPDKTQNTNGTTDAVNRIKVSQETLSDPLKRRIYVEQLQAKGCTWSVNTVAVN